MIVKPYFYPMKAMTIKSLFFLFGIYLLSSCEDDDTLRNNPFLPDLGFNVSLDLDLPQYNNLKFPGNFEIVPNLGVRGVIIYNLNNDQYFAWEASDPNHIPNDCSRMTVTGITAFCPCTNDNHEYSIITGQQTQGDGGLSMKPYRIERTGNTLIISN